MPSIPIAERTYHWWCDAVIASEGAKQLKDNILFLMGLILHTPVIEEEERTESRQLHGRTSILSPKDTIQGDAHSLKDNPDVHAEGVMQSLEPVKQNHAAETAEVTDGPGKDDSRFDSAEPIIPQEFDGRFIT